MPLTAVGPTVASLWVHQSRLANSLSRPLDWSKQRYSRSSTILVHSHNHDDTSQNYKALSDSAYLYLPHRSRVRTAMANAKSVLEGLTANRLFDLRGVVAVVTGGASGIGLMISSTLMANGAKVYIIDINQERLDRLTKTYNEGAAETMGKMHAIRADISAKSEASRIAVTLANLEPNGVTVLFNNAGIHTGQFKRPEASTSTTASSSPKDLTAKDYVNALFDAVSEEQFIDTYKVNTLGAYWLTAAMLPLLEKWKLSQPQRMQDNGADLRNANGGRGFAPQVVMTSSMNGWTKDLATAGFSFPYSFSKSAIGIGTASLAHELLPLGIRVNGIAPGLFPTEMAAPGTSNELGFSSIPQPSDPASRLPVSFEVPVTNNRSGGTRFDIGTLALFLVSNWFVNGETVLIDGGTLLKHPSSY